VQPFSDCKAKNRNAMGVLSFYRWLADKYPLIIVDVIEEEAEMVDGVAVPLDTTQINPNG